MRELARRTNMAHPLVLIIDADETARDLYGHWFSAHGFQVMCAVGTVGLSLALRRERPQLIVTELRARDLTLAALTARLQSDATTRCIPILVLTSASDRTVIDSAKAAGVAVVLAKWCDFDLLDSWVSALCS
jgi:CheY-like chemotaxis protein